MNQIAQYYNEMKVESMCSQCARRRNILQYTTNHHRVILTAQISQTLSLHPSLSSITPSNSVQCPH